MEPADKQPTKDKFVVFDENTIKRFWGKVNTQSSEECWNWVGYRDRCGYGRFNYKTYPMRKCMPASRYSLLLSCGQPPTEGTWLCCHRCDNTSCVNPNHLYWGTPKDNVADMHKRGRAVKAVSKTRRLTSEMVVEVRAKLQAGVSKSSLGREYGVHRSSIRQIALGRTYRSVI